MGRVPVKGSLVMLVLIGAFGQRCQLIELFLGVLGAKANCWGNNDETHGHTTSMIHNHSCVHEDYFMLDNNHHGNCHQDNPIDQLVCNPKGHFIYYYFDYCSNIDGLYGQSLDSNVG